MGAWRCYRDSAAAGMGSVGHGSAVFVHGVATRSGSVLNLAESNMMLLLKTAVFSGVPLAFHAPHWGNSVPVIRGFETRQVSASFALMGGDGALGEGPVAESGGSSIERARSNGE